MYRYDYTKLMESHPWKLSPKAASDKSISADFPVIQWEIYTGEKRSIVKDNYKKCFSSFEKT
jgi:hypothetical protein